MRGSSRFEKTAHINEKYWCKYLFLENLYRSVSNETITIMFHRAVLALKEAKKVLEYTESDCWSMHMKNLLNNLVVLTALDSKLEANMGHYKNVLQFLFDFFRRHFPHDQSSIIE